MEAAVATSQRDPPPELKSSGSYLVWEDLTVVLPSYSSSRPAKKLIHGLNGYAVPCRLMAIMGPSGSGKSTLLDSLAGRLANNVVMTGKVLLNSRKRRLDYGVVAYVTQENTLLGTLTVRETVTYSAQLRLPPTMSKKEKENVVERTIKQMGLHDCADTAIGNWHLRGISGGEKKRLSVALEILTGPRLLFLDEPTTGLDSSAAFMVAVTLRQMAEDGMTVVSSIHQPSEDVFSLFDDLCLLSGGEMVYFGDAKKATEFFQQAGFRCPTRRNPSDHFLRCINTDFDSVNGKLRGSRGFWRISNNLKTVADDEEAGTTTTSMDPLLNMKTSKIISRLIDQYKRSQYATTAKQMIKEISKIEGLTQGPNKGNQAKWQDQLTTLTRRSFVNMSRDIGYYWLRILVYIIVSVCVGTMFFDVGTDNRAILARSSSAGFIFGFMSLMSIGGFPSFIEEMKVFYRERINGHYGVVVYVLSNFSSSFPFLLAVSLCSSAIMYYMVKLHSGFSRFLFFTANLYGSVAVVESIMMIVASLVPNFLMGIELGTGITGIFMLAAGFLRLLPDLPKPFWRYPISYMSYGSWALQGQYKNDMLGLEFDPVVPGNPNLTGEYVVQRIFGVSLDHSKWVDLTAIFVLLISYRFLFFVVLKFKERASPWFRLVNAMIAFRSKKGNVPKKNLCLSSRHQPLHPMDSQEGLTSPLP